MAIFIYGILQEIKVFKNHLFISSNLKPQKGYNIDKKVPDVDVSIKILVQHSILLAKKDILKRQSTISRKRYIQPVAAIYAIRLLHARSYHYPIQYLVGQWPFGNLVLKIKPPILIPRFQTEYLIGELVKQIRRKWVKGSSIKFVDLGCGSGAIGLSLIKQLQQDYLLSGTLLDINPKCLSLAQQNLIKNNINPQIVQFVCEDMRNATRLINECQVILSNPPYLTRLSHQRLQKQVKLYQSQEALIGGDDGLEYINWLVPLIMSEKKRDLICFIEYGGQNINHLGVEENVRLDQYNRRRYIVFV